MRKITLVGIAVAIAMGFLSCNKENATSEQTAGKLVTETFSVTMDRSATKTATDDGGTSVSWCQDDLIHYYTANDGTIREAAVSSSGSSATLTLEREECDSYYNLVYSGGTAPTFTTKTSASMVFDGVRALQDGTFANANVSVAHTTPGAGGITFKPVTALVRFTTGRTDIKTIVLTGGAGTEKVAGDITVDPTAVSPKGVLTGNGSTEITVTVDTPAAGTYYINLLPATYSNGLKLILKDAGGNVIGPVIAYESIDLSKGGAMLNFADIDSYIQTDLGSSGTANSYIVSSAGTYKFKAVKGNSTESVGDVKGVKVLWESFGTSTKPDVGDLIKANVYFSDDYIIFSTGGNFREGNAVIAAYGDAGCTAGNVLWSWHIWLTDQPSGQVYNNGAGTMMDRNLGATSADKGDVCSLGLLYQWGRKDPFLGADSYNYKYPLTVHIAASTLDWPEALNVQDNKNDDELNLRASIANPTAFIRNFDYFDFDWYCQDNNYRNDNLWNVTAGKTIYDPCPPGWRVPEGGEDSVWAKAGFSSQIFDVTNRGMDFGSYTTSSVCWYPAAGCLSPLDGSLAAVFSEGYYWSRSPFEGKAYCFLFDMTEDVYPSYPYFRGYAYPVRCISDSGRVN